MSLRLITGRAGSGKTRYILDEIRARLEEDPGGSPLLLIVPEQATFQMEQALVATPGLGGSMRAQVLSFRRLAHRIMQETGGSAVVAIGENGKAMLVRRALVAHRDRLRLFRGDTPGLAGKLNELLTEWKRYGISPRQVEEAAEAFGTEGPSGDAMLADKLHDLALVYGETERQLAGRWQDGEDMLARLGEGIARSAALNGAEVWLDGFHGFTPNEYAVIEALLKRCARVTVALCLDRPYAAGEVPDELELFHRTAETSRTLCELAEAAGVPVEPAVRLEPETCPRFADSPMLAHLEAALRGGGRWRGGDDLLQPDHPRCGISLHAAANPRAEAEAAARDMLRRVREEGLRWRDMAVYVRKVEDYADLLRAVFEDYGIPYFLDAKASAAHHPLVELIRSSLEAVASGWRTEAILRCAKTDLLQPSDGSLTRDDVDELENYVLAAGIDGWRWHDDRFWRPLDDGGLEEEADEAAAPAMAGPTAKVPAEMPPGASGRFGEAGRPEAGPPDACGLPAGAGRSGADSGADADLRPDPGGRTEAGGRPEAERRPDDAARFRRLRDALLEPLCRMERRFRKARTFRDLCEALFGLLEETRSADRLERWSEADLAAGDPGRARLHRQVWDGVIGLLDQLVELAGDDPADVQLFAEMVDAGLEQLQLGVVPPSLDGVLIGSPERTRSDRLQVVYLLGVNDGVMPMAVREDGLLSESERERLASAGWKMAPGARRRLLDERFLVYLAFTAPARHLWIGYPLANEEGEGLLPSEMIRRLRAWFPGLPVQTETPEPAADDPEERQLAHAAHPGRALTHWIARIRQWRQGGPLATGWWSVHRWLVERREWRERLERLLLSLRYTNGEPPLSPETSRLLYGDRLRASVSRMEQFVACPFRHFAAYGLRLMPRRLYRVDAPDIGQLFHAALRATLERMLAGPDEPSAADWRREAAAAAERLLPRLQSEILLSSHRHRAIARKLTETVARAGAVLAEHARKASFRPVGLEIPFGPDAPLPPLTVNLGDGRTLDVVGRIDRVDAADTPQGLLLRVIDYKSGDANLRLDEVAHGLSLQMLTYLDVVVSHAPAWLGRPAKPAGVLYFHVHNPLLHVSNRLSPAEAAAALAREFRMRGLVLADGDAVLRMDASLAEGGKSAIVPVEIRKDGSFSSRSQVAEAEQWEILRRAVRANIRRIGRRIAAGDVSIAPYRMNRQSPCAHCEFRPICQFDPSLEGNRYQVLRTAENRDALWRQLAETAGGGNEAAGEDGEGR